MVTFNDKESLIYNGGRLNSFIRFRNKELAKWQNKISYCQKYTSHLISYCNWGY
ncbi:MAG: hypothetical protein R6V14_00795 [Halanaerobiales bacterium]